MVACGGRDGLSNPPQEGEVEGGKGVRGLVVIGEGAAAPCGTAAHVDGVTLSAAAPAALPKRPGLGWSWGAWALVLPDPHVGSTVIGVHIQ